MTERQIQGYICRLDSTDPNRNFIMTTLLRSLKGSHKGSNI